MKAGDIATIYNTKSNGDAFEEGKAKLIKKVPVDYADNLWEVRFPGETDTYKRFVEENK